MGHKEDMRIDKNFDMSGQLNDLTRLRRGGPSVNGQFDWAPLPRAAVKMK
jgi:hypothetical protein